MGNPAVTAEQFDLVYDVLSFSLATMMATTIFIWMRLVRCVKSIMMILVYREYFFFTECFLMNYDGFDHLNIFFRIES